MADIDIQEKKRGSVWPWILGALALVLVIWGATEMMGGDDEEFVANVAEEQQAGEAAPMAQTADESGLPMEVTQFEQQCGQGNAQDAMGSDHEYVNQCIQHMTAALDAVVQREQVNDTQLSEEFDRYRQRADNLTQSAQSPEHAAVVSDVFDNAATLIRRIEESRSSASAATGTSADAGTPAAAPGTASAEGTTPTTSSGDHAQRVQDAADGINANEALLEQREEVSAFFREVSSALRTLATR